MRKKIEEVEILLNSKMPLIFINTTEEAIIVQDLIELIETSFPSMTINIWNEFSGILDLSTISPEYKMCPPNSLLSQIKATTEVSSKVWIIKDFNVMLKQSSIIRGIRNISERRDNKYYNPIIFIACNNNIPIELEQNSYSIDYDLPDKEEIEQLTNDMCNVLKKSNRYEIPSDDIKRSIINNCIGLTKNQILNMFAKSIIKNKKLDDKYILEEKIETVKQNNVLDFKIPKAKFEDIGGNDIIKDWILEVEKTSTQAAKDFGCPSTKGYLAVGIPGCSKSYMAEAIANKWNVPFLQLSMSKIMNKLVGESEKKIAQAFEIAKMCSPCVFLWDEVEKLFGGVQSSNASDSGTLNRVMASALNFLQENEDVFVIMTSNDISQLPAAFIRSGRIDAIWYFGLPYEEERKEILKIHFNRFKKDIDETILNTAIARTNNFTGSELEQVVKNTIKKSYIRSLETNDTQISIEDLESAINDIVPIYSTYKEQINYLEQWCKSRAKRTSANNKKIETKTDEDSLLNDLRNLI